MELDRTIVRAPTSGTIGLRNAERGQIAGPNSQLFLIGDLAQLQVEILLTERNLSYIRQGMPVDLLPAIEMPELSVQVSYPNVGPEEIELLITEPLENALSVVPDVERMTSFSREGNASVSLRFAQGVDIDVISNDVREALDRVRRSIPDEADAPRINREIRVEVSRDRLLASGLTMNDISAAIGRENTTLPGGNVQRGLSDLYVRSRCEHDNV